MGSDPFAFNERGIDNPIGRLAFIAQRLRQERSWKTLEYSAGEWGNPGGTVHDGTTLIGSRNECVPKRAGKGPAVSRMSALISVVEYPSHSG
jgi:hypothetical protein